MGGLGTGQRPQSAPCLTEAGAAFCAENVQDALFSKRCACSLGSGPSTGGRDPAEKTLSRGWAPSYGFTARSSATCPRPHSPAGGETEGPRGGGAGGCKSQGNKRQCQLSAGRAGAQRKRRPPARPPGATHSPPPRGSTEHGWRRSRAHSVSLKRTEGSPRRGRPEASPTFLQGLDPPQTLGRLTGRRTSLGNTG